MALSATLSLSSATTNINQPIVATVVISNSGGSQVTLQICQPTVIQTGSSQSVGEVPFSAGAMLDGLAGSLFVPGGGTLTLLIPYTFFSPSNLNPSSSTYDVGVNLTTSDGSFFRPSVSTVTVNQLNFQDAT